MKNLIVSLLFVLVSVFGFSQNKYDFDIPARSKNDVGVFNWFIDALDSTSDSLLIKMFEMSNTNIDSIDWTYSTTLVDSLTMYGQNFYNKTVYFADTKNNLITTRSFEGQTKLPKNQFTLMYYYRDGVTYLTLVEYY